MSYFFTSESVSEGHPDKVADQISDALLDEFLRRDPNSHVACETLVTTGLVLVSGEVTCEGYVDIQHTVREVVRNIGYTKGEYMFEADSCAILSTIHGQSSDINQGVSRATQEEQGAGDQGMMFGYACNETPELMPLPITLAHIFLQELSKIRKEGREMKYLRPDAKSQITIEYNDEGRPLRVEAIVISTQHDDFDEEGVMLARIERDVREILIPRVLARLSRDNRDRRLLWTRMVVEERTAAVGSAARMPRRWTARRHTPHVISPRTWWRLVCATRCWCRWHTP